MKNIERKSVKKECEDIRNQRNCPKCSSIILYKTEKYKTIAEKNNRLCKTCLNEKLSKTNTGKKLSKKTKDKLSKIFKGRPILWKDKISEAKKQFYLNNPNELPKGEKNPMYGIHRFGKENPNFGKKWNEEKKEKARIQKTQEFINRGYTFNNYNPKACEYLNKLNEENGWKLQHALNGGEIIVYGYFIDAYDKQNNIVVEYDEPHHYTINGNLRKRDIKRQNKIIQELKCKFFRFNEKENKFYEVI